VQLECDIKGCRDLVRVSEEGGSARQVRAHAWLRPRIHETRSEQQGQLGDLQEEVDGLGRGGGGRLGTEIKLGGSGPGQARTPRHCGWEGGGGLRVRPSGRPLPRPGEHRGERGGYAHGSKRPG
jgi:hypothetical protein